MRKFTMDYDRDCGQYVKAVVTTALMAKEYTEITFPDRDLCYMNIESKYEPGTDLPVVVEIETQEGFKSYRYRWAEEAIEEIGELAVETMDNWGWFNG